MTTTTTALLPGAAADPLQLDLKGLARRAGWIGLAWLALFVGWATLAPISGGVVAMGLVKSDGYRQTVSHRDGGTVVRIAVREGESVKQGQLLLELGDVRVDASLEMVRAQHVAERLRLARLEAEAAGATSWTPPAWATGADARSPGIASTIAKERSAFAAHRRSLESQVEALLEQQRSTEMEIAVRERERINAQRAWALMQEELASNEQLVQQQFVNRSRILTLQRSVSEYESRVQVNEAELAQAKQRRAGLEAQIRSLREGLAQRASDELRESAVRVGDLDQRLRASQDDVVRQRVIAPVAGRLVNLRINTPGSAVGPREPIVDIVPDDAPLLVEAKLNVESAADVRVGTPAEVRLLHSGQRFEKLLPAKVVRMSADALVDERSGAAYFTSLIEVPADEVAATGLGRLQAGLGAEVYIKVTERSPLGFLMEPLTGFFRRGFRDR